MCSQVIIELCCVRRPHEQTAILQVDAFGPGSSIVTKSTFWLAFAVSIHQSKV